MILLAVCFFMIYLVLYILGRSYERFSGSPMPILVISLPGSPRRERVMQKLARYKGRVIIIDGVLVKTEDAKRKALRSIDLDYDEMKDSIKLATGELGCTLAHINCYKYILEHKIDTALILEDDIVLKDPNAIDYIENFDISKNKGLEYMFLHCTTGYGTQAQIVTSKGAETLYKNRKDLILIAAIDNVIWANRIPITYVIGPQLFDHEDEYNNINTSERLQIDKGIL